MSTNISKIRRDELIKKIRAIRGYIAKAEQDDNSANLLGYLLELEKEVKGKKYGLVFEEHRENIDYKMDNNTPILIEDSELFIDNGGQMNFLIEGDNLSALNLLQKTHRGKIDLIYIDPPYNTGEKDFMYNDVYLNANDEFKHSQWCSFISKRLQIAKLLLSKDGVIFISINDIELAPLRIICDEVFGENNFIGQLVWESTTQPINAGKARFQLQKKTESILCFAKNKAKREVFVLEELKSDLNYPHDGKLGKCRFEVIEKSDSGRYKRDTMKFPILGQYPRAGKRWQIGIDTAKELERLGKVEVVDGIVKRAIYPEDELDKISFVPFWSFLSADMFGSALNGKEELNTIMGRSVGFDTVKPTRLIKKLISHLSNNITVLDFFAGSGTTGHAVMELNKVGGKRKFILVTNNENNICRDITYERIKRVIETEQYEDSLKYYKVDYVPISDRMYYEYADELLKHTRELVELENGINFSGNKKIAILLTDEELDAFMGDIESHKSCKKIYLGHDVLVSGEYELVLKECKIKINVIPDYYYKELGA